PSRLSANAGMGDSILDPVGGIGASSVCNHPAVPTTERSMVAQCGDPHCGLPDAEHWTPAGVSVHLSSSLRRSISEYSDAVRSVSFGPGVQSSDRFHELRDVSPRRHNYRVLFESGAG